MSPARSRTARRGAAAILSLLGAGVGALSCLPPGELLLKITSNMNLDAFDHLDINICALDDNTVPVRCVPKDADLWVSNDKPDTVTVPGTLGITSRRGEPTRVSILVSATMKVDTLVVEQDLQITQIHPNELTEMEIPLDYLCVSSDKPPLCPPGESCHNGECIDLKCPDNPSPATCDPDSPLCDLNYRCVNGTCVRELCPIESDGSGPLADAQCFDVLACFADGWDAGVGTDPVSGNCVSQLNSKQYTQVNLALMLNKDHADAQLGFCDDDRCLIPLDDQPKKGGVLPPAICAAIDKGTIMGVMAADITESCPRKTGNGIPVSKLSIKECRPKKDWPSWLPEVPGGSRGSGGSKHWSVRLEETSGSASAGRLFAAAVRVDSPAAGAGVLVTGGASSGASILELLNLAPDIKHYNMDCMKDDQFEDGKTCQYPYLLTSDPLPRMRAAHTANVVGEKVLVIGGVGVGTGIDMADALVADAEWIQPSAGESASSAAGTMTSPRAFHTATLSEDEKTVLVAGGITGDIAAGIPTSGIEIYDVDTGQFLSDSMEKMSTARFGHTATPIRFPTATGVLIIGGLLQLDQAVSTVEYLEENGATKTGKSDPMDQSRAFHTATPLENGMILVAGGLTSLSLVGFDPTASVGIYQYLDDKWTWKKVSSMSHARAFHTATLLDGQVLVVGGLTNTGTPAPPELYDPIMDSWTPVEAHDAALRAFHTATLLSGNVLFAGGGTLNLGNGSLVASENLLLYTP